MLHWYLPPTVDTEWNRAILRRTARSVAATMRQQFTPLTGDTLRRLLITLGVMLDPAVNPATRRA